MAVVLESLIGRSEHMRVLCQEITHGQLCTHHTNSRCDVDIFKFLCRKFLYTCCILIMDLDGNSHNVILVHYRSVVVTLKMHRGRRSEL